MAESRNLLWPLALTAFLGGCGGSGGVASPGTVAVAPVPVTPTPAPTPAPSPPALTPADLVASPRPASRSANDTNEFRTNYNSVELIGLLFAADAGITGRGVTVGVVDGGFYTNAPDLAGRMSPLSRDFGNLLTRNPDGSYASTARNNVGFTPASNHGSLVSELIAGSRNGSGGVGVAPDASLAYLRVDDAKLGEPNADGTVNATITTANITAAINHAASVAIPVISVSLGITGGRSPSTTAAIDRFAAAGGLFVISAGNNGGTSPESTQLLSNANRASWISVGGLSTATDAFTLNSESARAGTLADRYIVAAYENIAADPQGNGFFRFTGTSGSVPLVAGAAALVLQKWPQLSGRAAGDVLLATARDIGATGTDAVFGRGLLDLRAALSPVSPTLVTPTGSAIPVASAGTALPAAVGTGRITRLLATTVILDRFGRDFTVDARGLVARRSDIGSVAAATQTVRRNRAGTSAFSISSDVAFAAGPVRDGDPVARLTGTAIEVRVGAGSVAFTHGYAPWSGSAVAGLGAPASALAAYAGTVGTGVRSVVPVGRGALTIDAGAATWGATRAVTAGRPQAAGAAGRVQAAGAGWSDGRLSLGGGFVAEGGALFGVHASGPLAPGGADTGFAEARYARAAGEWTLSGYASVGMTRLRGSSVSLLTDPGALVTSRFGVEAARGIGTARVSLGVAQPLNVEQGAATLTHATGYDLASRALTFTADRVDLRGDRQLLAQGSVDFGPFRVGLVQGVLRPETGVVTAIGWRF